MKKASPVARSLGVPACIAAVVAAFSAPLHAQQYPTKVVRVIVPFAPGGGSDLTARQFSAKLSEYLGQQFVVDNRGGAGGLIGMEMTAKAVPDGYTIMMMSGSFSATSALNKPKFDPIHAIVPVAEFGITPFVLTVHPSLPPKSVKELIAMARAKPNALSYASPGVGSITHLSTELFLNMTKTKMVHIPYKSTGAAMSDLLSGQAPIIVGSLLPVEPHLKTGRLRGLAVTTEKRWYSLPQVPTVNETVKDYAVELWFGAMAPRGTPEAIINTINGAINKALQSEDLKTSLGKQGLMGTGGTPQKFGERINREYKRWLKVVDDANIKIE